MRTIVRMNGEKDGECGKKKEENIYTVEIRVIYTYMYTRTYIYMARLNEARR